MNSKIQIMDVTNKTFLFRNRDDIFLIGDIDIGYPVQLDFKLSTTGKKSKWRFNTARVSVCRCKETQYDDWDNSLDFTGKSKSRSKSWSKSLVQVPDPTTPGVPSTKLRVILKPNESEIP